MRICSTNVEQVPKKMKTTEKYSPFNAVISENYVFLRSKQFLFRREMNFCSTFVVYFSLAIKQMGLML